MKYKIDKTKEWLEPITNPDARVMFGDIVAPQKSNPRLLDAKIPQDGVQTVSVKVYGGMRINQLSLYNDYKLALLKGKIKIHTGMRRVMVIYRPKPVYKPVRHPMNAFFSEPLPLP